MRHDDSHAVIAVQSATGLIVVTPAVMSAGRLTAAHTVSMVASLDIGTDSAQRSTYDGLMRTHQRNRLSILVNNVRQGFAHQVRLEVGNRVDGGMLTVAGRDDDGAVNVLDGGSNRE